jgi:1-acyl-sn-glycerol-3-phosphate acyltransferase
VWILLIIALMLLFAEATRRILDNPRGDIVAGLYWRIAQVYSRLMHRLQVRGDSTLRRQRRPGPLILIANHTAGVDPVLVQAVCNFEPRWIMAEDMRHPAAQPLWDYGRIIFIDREKGDLGATREAIRHVRSGGVLGIFPEGRIERPPRTLLPFQQGVGFIIKRSNAPVLPVVIEGTPTGPTAWSSLYTPSRASITFHPPIDYSKTDLSAEEIVEDLQQRYQEWTGWPMRASAQD